VGVNNQRSPSGPYRLELLVSIDGLIRHYSVDVNAVSLAGEVTELRELLEIVEPGYLDAGQQLYDWVVAPYTSELVSAGAEKRAAVVAS
jgi:hypothetical protein